MMKALKDTNSITSTFTLYIILSSGVFTIAYTQITLVDSKVLAWRKNKLTRHILRDENCYSMRQVIFLL